MLCFVIIAFAWIMRKLRNRRKDSSKTASEPQFAEEGLYKGAPFDEDLVLRAAPKRDHESQNRNCSVSITVEIKVPETL